MSPPTKSALSELRAARSLAREELSQTMSRIKAELKQLKSPAWTELIAELEGGVHELDLLHKRELSLVANGVDLHTQEVGTAP